MIVNTRSGKMKIIEEDAIVSSSLRHYGEWAQLEINALCRFIEPNDTVIDVGAFIGTHTIAFANRVGRDGYVHSFEPRQAIHRLLTENVQLNSLSWVTCWAKGLTDKAVDFYKDDLPEKNLNLGGFSLKNQSKGAQNGNVEISCVTLDSLNLGLVNFMKVDVEGMEAEVLNGAASLLASSRPVIACEVNNVSNAIALLDFALSNRFGVFAGLFPAFNPENFASFKTNFFGDAKELSLLLIPLEKLKNLEAKVFDLQLAPVRTVDDIVLALLHKPQYYSEILANCAASSDLDMAFSTPRSEQIAEIVGEKAEQISALNLKLTEIQSELDSKLALIARQHDVIQARDETIAQAQIALEGSRAFSTAQAETIGRYVKEQSRLEQEQFRLEQEQCRLEQEQSRLNGELANLQTTFNSTSQALVQSRALEVVLRDELTKRSNVIESLEFSRDSFLVNLKAAETRIEGLMQSSSWRLTKPLRAISGYWQKLFNKQLPVENNLK